MKEPISSWIAHTSGAPPISNGDVVVQTMSVEGVIAPIPRCVSKWDWEHLGLGSDIGHYRIVSLK